MTDPQDIIEEATIDDNASWTSRYLAILITNAVYIIIFYFLVRAFQI